MSVWIPLLVVVATASAGNSNVGQRRRRDIATAACGLLSSIGVSECSTQLLKVFIQRRRPNFYDLCGWNSQLLQCMATKERIREANFSFPSGHSSLACCAMTYLVWFFLGKTVSATSLTLGQKRFVGAISCIVPWSWAIFVGATRIVDHWHHPSDVLAGLLLGGLCSTVMYHVWYPPVWSKYVGVPWMSLLTKDTAMEKLVSFSD